MRSVNDIARQQARDETWLKEQDVKEKKAFLAHHLANIFGYADSMVLTLGQEVYALIEPGVRLVVVRDDAYGILMLQARYSYVRQFLWWRWVSQTRTWVYGYAGESMTQRRKKMLQILDRALVASRFTQDALPSCNEISKNS